MRRFRLRARFLFVLVILLVAMFAAITLVIVRENTHTLRTGLVDQSKSFAALATQPIGDNFVLYKDSGTVHIKQEISTFTTLDSSINQVQVVDTNGKSLFADTSMPTIPVSSDAAGSVEATYIYDKGGNLTAIVEPYLEDFGIHRYDVAYGISYDSVNKNIREVVTLIISLSVVILIISLIVWYVLINRLFLRPVAKISQTALLISKGDLDRTIHSGRNDEIGDVAAAVDIMATSLKSDIAKLKEVDRLKSEFLMITSHNLRTPLTIIQGYMEMMNDTQPTPKQAELMEPIATNVMRLQGFAEDVLTISNIETNQSSLHREPQAMQPILERTAHEFEALARQKKLRFSSSIDTNVWVNLDKPQFHSALWNLLDNAYKFTHEAGAVELTARTNGDRLEITVKDTGMGIRKDEMPKLFTKFHRGTDTLVYEYEGTGIGLYISQLIIRGHGGDISASSVQNEGSSFTIWLPTIPPPADRLRH